MSMIDKLLKGHRTIALFYAPPFQHGLLFQISKLFTCIV